MAIVLFLLSPVLSVVRAFVLVKLWSWFAVPLGVVPIGKAWAYGLVVLVNLMNPDNSSFTLSKIEKKLGVKPDWVGAFVLNLAVSGMALLLGYIAKALMQ